MCEKRNFSTILLLITLIVGSTFQSIFATKEELDERILSPKSEENEEVPNVILEGVLPGVGEEDPRFPYLPPSDNEANLPQNIEGSDEDYAKRSFQPWGGKRSSFQPWGGKRSSFQPWGGKRSSFQPWGGKRSSFQPWGGKRSSFQPWGGKRSKLTDYFRRLSNWGGKRDPMARNPQKSDVPTARRSTFNPWGG